MLIRLILTILLFHASTADANEERTVREMVVNALVAESKGNVEGYMSNWHPNGVQLFAGTSPVKGRQAIAQSLTEFIDTYDFNVVTPLEKYCPDVTLSSEMAIVNCHVLVKIRRKNSEGPFENMDNQIVYILIKENGVWMFWQENTMTSSTGN